jgi:hypothetical protein
MVDPDTSWLMEFSNGIRMPDANSRVDSFGTAPNSIIVYLCMDSIMAAQAFLDYALGFDDAITLTSIRLVVDFPR